MLIVCIGVGDQWGEVAETSAQRMSSMTGLEHVVVRDMFYPAIHPSWLKCHVARKFPDEESFLVMDADMLCLQPWQPQRMFEDMRRPFMAVSDSRCENTLKECEALGIPFPSVYMNGGLTIFGREHQYIWNDVWKRHPICGRYLEQGSLNLSLLLLDPQMCRLPDRFNFVTYQARIKDAELKAMDCINVHVAGCAGQASIVREAQTRFFNGVKYEANSTLAASY